MHISPRRFVPCLVSLALVACYPSLDWREVQPQGAGVRALFPCKPSHEVRKLAVADQQVVMAVDACHAAGSMFALASVDVADPRLVGAALSQFRAASLRNFAGTATSQLSFEVPGMTPHPEALVTSFTGRTPDGRTIQGRTATFSKGTRVFQATVFGDSVNDEAVATFFGGLDLRR